MIHAQAYPTISKTKQQYFWEGLSYFFYLLRVVKHYSATAIVLSSCFGWVWSGPAQDSLKQLISNYLWKGLSDFADFL